MATTKSKDLLHFELEYNLDMQGYLQTKVIVEVLPNHIFLILSLTNQLS